MKLSAGQLLAATLAVQQVEAQASSQSIIDSLNKLASISDSTADILKGINGQSALTEAPVCPHVPLVWLDC